MDYPSSVINAVNHGASLRLAKQVYAWAIQKYGEPVVIAGPGSGRDAPGWYVGPIGGGGVNDRPGRGETLKKAWLDAKDGAE